MKWNAWLKSTGRAGRSDAVGRRAACVGSGGALSGLSRLVGDAVGACDFLGGEYGLGAVGAVFGEPVVGFEAEGFGGGAVAEVDVGLDLGAAEGDAVVFDEDVAARGEAGFAGFLEDAEDPFGGVEDGVAGELGAVDADEGSGAEAAFDVVVADDDASGFVLGAGGTEVGEAGGAADVEGAFAGVEEAAFFHDDAAGAAFELDSGAGGEAGFAGEAAVGDEGVVTADEVDALAAPAGDGAVADGELLQAGAFDSVVIAGGADVADFEVVEGDAGDGGIELAAVVEVEAVGGLAGDVEVAEGEVRAAAELEGGVAADEAGRVVFVEGFEGEVLDAGDVMAAGVVAGGDLQGGVGLEIGEGGAEGGRVFDDEGLSQGGGGEEQG